MQYSKVKTRVHIWHSFSCPHLFVYFYRWHTTTLSFFFMWSVFYFLLHIKSYQLFIHYAKPTEHFTPSFVKGSRSPNQMTYFFQVLPEALLFMRTIMLISLVIISENLWSWLTKNYRSETIYGQVSWILMHNHFESWQFN